MKYWTIKANNEKGNSLKTSIEAETEIKAKEKFLLEWDEYYDIINIRPSGRYNYSTTGYGVLSILGHFYASGRIEIYDRENDTGFAWDEGSYWVPLKAESKLRNFFDDLETDMPMKISVGNMSQIDKAVADKIGVSVDRLKDDDVKKEYSNKKYQEYLNGLSDEDKEYLEEKYGSNSSVWLDGDDIKCGSRNRELTLDNDNAGFYKSILDDYDNIHQYLYKHPTHRLFGEWLIPHTLKTYDKDAWRKFYVFDVMIEDEYINYDIYKEWLEEYDIEYILKVIGK